MFQSQIIARKSLVVINTAQRIRQGPDRGCGEEGESSICIFVSKQNVTNTFLPLPQKSQDSGEHINPKDFSHAAEDNADSNGFASSKWFFIFL